MTIIRLHNALLNDMVSAHPTSLCVVSTQFLYLYRPGTGAHSLF